MRRVHALQQWNAERGGLACTCLREGNDVVAVSQQIWNHFFLHWHGMLESQLFNGVANLFAYTQFFKCLQCVLLFLLCGLCRNDAACLCCLKNKK